MTDTEISFNDLLLSGSSFNKTRVSDSVKVESPTSSQKWWAAGLMGMLFIILSSRAAYNITGCVIGRKTFCGSGPTMLGIILQALLFIIAVRIILG